MISLIDISLEINNKVILDQINIDINNGDIIGIIGSPESGKTSLLKILSNQIINYNGQIKIDNTNIKKLKNIKLIKKLSYYPFLNIKDPYITVYNLFLMSRLPYKKPFLSFSTYDFEVIDHYIEEFNLTKYKNSYIQHLSEDITKRILLAFTFIRESQIILLDNPTDGCSEYTKSLLHNQILKFCFNGRNICIIASHDLNFITQCVDYILIMHKGKIIKNITPYELDANIIKKYLGLEATITKNIYNGKPNINIFYEL